MKKLIIAVLFIILVIPVTSMAWTSRNTGFSGGSRIHIGMAGGRHGNFHQSVRHRAVQRSYRGHRGISRVGYRGQSVRHIHRQAGRVYYQGSCLPIVVVPSGIVYRY